MIKARQFKPCLPERTSSISSTAETWPGWSAAVVVAVPALASDAAALTTEGDTHHIQLDGIRALAVLSVMADHYITWTTDYIPLGSIGVRVFFVLSGFLITGILLRARNRVEAGQASSSPFVFGRANLVREP